LIRPLGRKESSIKNIIFNTIRLNLAIKLIFMHSDVKYENFREKDPKLPVDSDPYQKWPVRWDTDP